MYNSCEVDTTSAGVFVRERHLHVGTSIFIEHFIGNENVLPLRSSFNRRQGAKLLSALRDSLLSSKPVLNT